MMIIQVETPWRTVLSKVSEMDGIPGRGKVRIRTRRTSGEDGLTKETQRCLQGR